MLAAREAALMCARLGFETNANISNNIFTIFVAI